MSALTSGKRFFFSVIDKQAKRMMSDTESPSDRPPPSKLSGNHYRVWSLTGQGFLTFIPTDRADSDSSGTGKENSSE